MASMVRKAKAGGSQQSTASLGVGRKPLGCETCHMVFQTKQEFLEHMSTYHEFVIEITPPVNE